MPPTSRQAGEITLRRYFQRANPYFETGANTSDQYVLSLPLRRGEIRLESEGRLLHDGEVLPGMLRITSPGEALRLHRRSPADAMILTMAGPMFRRIAGELGHGGSTSTRIAPVVTPMPRIARLTSTLIDVAAIDEAQRPFFISGVATALLAVAFGSREGAAPRHGLDRPQLARCIEFAETHPDARIDLTTWANAVGMPVGEFTRRFQASTGLAPYAWLLDWRIERSKRLLADRDQPLARVALEAGFCSQSHYTDAFRRRVGLSPGRWRRMQLPGS